MLQKREWEWTAKDRATFVGMKAGLDRLPPKARRKIFHSWRAPYGLTSVQAGEVEAVHEVTTENVFRQHLVPVEGQTDILTMGLPYICPYNVNSIMNPILVMCLGLGYFFNLYRGKPLVREGGVLIMSHPTPWEFHPVHHPSYIDFFEQVLAETTDPVEIEARYEKQFAEDEWYRHLYRTSYAYHGVHPFYMWYWGATPWPHAGRGHRRRRRAPAGAAARLPPASTLGDALEMAADVVGRDAIDHPPPQPADASWRTCTLMAGVPGRLARRLPRLPFPYAAPTVPEGVEPPPTRPRSGADYDTDWARRYPARLARVALLEALRASRRGRPGPARAPRARPPRAAGRRRGPVIFAANHHSHVDTPLLLTSIPEPWRHKLFVGAAADYFFRTPVTSAAVGPRPRRHPHRAHQGGPPLGRPGRRPDRRRLVDADLPRGRPQPRRLGPAVPGRRRLPGAAVRRAGRAGPHRGHRPHPAQGPEAAAPASARVTFGAPLVRAEGDDSRRFGAPIEARGGGPGRRGHDRLVVGPPAGPRRRDPGARRARRPCLAPGLGPRRPRPGAHTASPPLARGLGRPDRRGQAEANQPVHHTRPSLSTMDTVAMSSTGASTRIDQSSTSADRARMVRVPSSCSATSQ